MAFFSLFLQEKAIDWYDALQPTQRETVDDLLTEFAQFFCPSPLDHVLDTKTVFMRLQRPTEKVCDYVSAMQKLSKRIPGIDDELLKGMIVRGFLLSTPDKSFHAATTTCNRKVNREHP